MNKALKKLFFIATFALGITTVGAQKTFDNGIVTYKMTTTAQDPTAGEISMDADMTFHISGKKPRRP